MIEQVQIDFNKSLNILTGETGAGKSILLGALGMVIAEEQILMLFVVVVILCE